MSSEEINYSTLLGLTDELLSSQKIVRLILGGNSMYPHLRNKDYVTITKTSFNQLKIGDIIVFKAKFKYVAHRIIKIRKTDEGMQILPKGDSCKKPDNPILQDKYIGKIISFERNGRKINFETKMYKYYNFFLASISSYTPIVYSFVRFFKHLFRNKK